MPPTLDLTAAPSPPTRAALQRLPLALGLLAAALVVVRMAQDGVRPALAWLIGLLLGLTLYHASFGFASGYRRMFVHRDMRGVQAQLLLLALTTALFAPVLAAGSVLGQQVGGAWAPLGVSVAVGAFLFGIGMQLAGGCGSGTLYTAGGGSVRMLVVLGAACAGSFWASLHLGWWQRLPAQDALVLGDVLGWPLAVAVQLAVLGVLAWLLRHLARPASVAAPVHRVRRRSLAAAVPPRPVDRPGEDLSHGERRSAHPDPAHQRNRQTSYHSGAIRLLFPDPPATPSWCRGFFVTIPSA